MVPTSLLANMMDTRMVSRPDGRRHLLRRDQAVLIHRQIGHRIPLLFQIFTGMQNGVMLHIGGDDMLAFIPIPLGHPQQYGIIALRAAAGKNHLGRFAM